MSATTCAAVVSWPCPCGVVPSVTTISPKMSSLTVATSLLPENWSSGLIMRDWPKLFVPESGVEHSGVITRVVHAAVGRLVRHVLCADVVLLADLHGIEVELVRDDVDD